MNEKFEQQVEFRLTYDGVLKSASKGNGRVVHKHDIRRVFHRQMKALWRDHTVLKQFAASIISDERNTPWIDEWAANHARDGFRWLPLVVKGLTLCEVEVLILRRGMPGSFIAAGDIDGQVKTIFDALQIPEPGVLSDKGIIPEENEDPFFCLLQDDKLIAKATIETDSLLGPLSIDNRMIEERKTDARVVIKVVTKKIQEAPF